MACSCRLARFCVVHVLNYCCRVLPSPFSFTQNVHFSSTWWFGGKNHSIHFNHFKSVFSLVLNLFFSSIVVGIWIFLEVSTRSMECIQIQRIFNRLFEMLPFVQTKLSNVIRLFLHLFLSSRWVCLEFGFCTSKLHYCWF